MRAFFVNIKNLIYLIIWKITEFFSGISDIRDTYSATQIPRLLPFLLRTCTGIFYLFPLNLFCVIGLFTARRIIFLSEIWILIFACLVALSPSLIGVSMSRYLIMLYTPFLIFAAKAFTNTIKS